MAKSTVSPETKVTNQEELVPLYRVVLLDDDDHTYDYVIEMLQKIFIFSMDQAYRHAEEVDTAGRTVLITCGLPKLNSRAIKSMPMARTGVCPGRRVRCRRWWNRRAPGNRASSVLAIMAK